MHMGEIGSGLKDHAVQITPSNVPEVKAGNTEAPMPSLVLIR
jgi:hypothetical protein